MFKLARAGDNSPRDQMMSHKKFLNTMRFQMHRCAAHNLSRIDCRYSAINFYEKPYGESEGIIYFEHMSIH